MAGRTNFLTTISFAVYDVVKTWEFMEFSSDQLLLFKVRNESPKHDIQYKCSTVRFLVSSSS